MAAILCCALVLPAVAMEPFNTNGGEVAIEGYDVVVYFGGEAVAGDASFFAQLEL